MKILYILDGIGETSMAYNEFSRPLSTKQDISICTFWPSPIPVIQGIKLLEGDGSLGKFFKQLMSTLHSNAYDVIHLHHPNTAVLFIMMSIFHRARRNSIIYTVHNSFQNYRMRHKLFLPFIFTYAGQVVFCGQASSESFPAIYKALCRDKLHAIPNGLDIERVDQNFEAPVATAAHRPFTIITVGRLVNIKNHCSTLLAYQKSRRIDTKLLIVGDGKLRPVLEEKAKEFRFSDDVEFTGVIPRDQVYRYLRDADVFVSTSLGEGLPVAVLEAMACGCPVILSDIPPHREIASGTDFIPLVQPKDADGFAREILKFDNRPAKERAEIGMKCRRLVEERFSVKKMLSEYEKLYLQVVRSPL